MRSTVSLEHSIAKWLLNEIEQLVVYVSQYSRSKGVYSVTYQKLCLLLTSAAAYSLLQIFKCHLYVSCL
jgi:hypothetical protein